MEQKIELKSLTDEDRKFIEQAIQSQLRILPIVIICAIVNVFIFAYIFTGFFQVSFGLDEILPKSGAFVVVGLVMSILFIPLYLMLPPVQGVIKKVKKQKEGGGSRGKYEGIVKVLAANIITNKTSDSNQVTHSLEFKFYSELEKKERFVKTQNLRSKDIIDSIKSGEFVSIVYYSGLDKLRLLEYNGKNIGEANFKN